MQILSPSLLSVKNKTTQNVVCFEIFIQHARRLTDCRLSKPKGNKTVFMLNSAEHEICPVIKSQITNHSKFFLAKYS